MARSSRTPEAGSSLGYRLTIPIAGLALYGSLAWLWNAGAHSVYFGALRLLGNEPFSFPFVDIQAVLSAAECQRQGLDIYLTNPCDPLGRPHVYSPLWTALVPGFLGGSAAGWVGLSLDLIFILSWAVSLQPRNMRAVLVLGLATLSPMTVYALERANNDIIVYLLILCGVMLSTAARPYHRCAYLLYLAAGLLKYYPLALLTLLFRERRRDAVAGMITAGLVLILSGFYYRADLGKALSTIPDASYFADSFSARNLPFGMGEALGGGVGRSLIAFPLLAAIAAVAIARVGRTIRLLGSQQPDFNHTEMQCLVTGGILVTACFFAGQNINYRGIYLLLVLPGLIRLKELCREAPIRRFYRQMLAAALFVMWEEFFRRILHDLTAPETSQGLSSWAEILFWIGRELVWWWLVVGLTATLWLHFRQLPLVRDGISWAGRFVQSAERVAPR